LKDSEDFKDQKKILPDDDLSLKFIHYSTILFNHLNWEIRDQYLELLDKFIEKKMEIFNFQIAFCERYESIDKVADVLTSNRVLLSPDENSLDFGDLLSKIDSYCKAYSGDPEPFRNKFEIGDVEFRTSIEKISFQMKKLLKESLNVHL
jgi:hypothetical protein